jgi:hypothetical protein
VERLSLVVDLMPMVAHFTQPNPSLTTREVFGSELVAIAESSPVVETSSCVVMLDEQTRPSTHTV